MAAGALIVEEAGGRMTAMDGAPFDVWGREMLASNGALHHALLTTMAEWRARRVAGSRATDRTH